jgi:seryl-tRNA synthetase
LELDEERRRHAETTKILRKKERQVKEIIIQGEEDHKNVSLLQDSVEKLTQKLNVYKRQLQEQVNSLLFFSILLIRTSLKSLLI